MKKLHPSEAIVSSVKRKPYTIGLTGNIATGKSTVGRMLKDLGAELIDADQIAHQIIAPGGAAYEDVKQAFGAVILTPEGLIDRKKLGAIVFSDPSALKLLESLIHPPVICQINRSIAVSSAKVMVVEAIKLIEAGMAENYDAIWVTVCPEAIQLSRLLKIRKLSYDDAVRRLGAQPPQEDRIGCADVVIDTAGNLADTLTQVRNAWQKVTFKLEHTEGFQSAGN